MEAADLLAVEEAHLQMAEVAAEERHPARTAASSRCNHQRAGPGVQPGQRRRPEACPEARPYQEHQGRHRNRRTQHMRPRRPVLVGFREPEIVRPDATEPRPLSHRSLAVLLSSNCRLLGGRRGHDSRGRAAMALGHLGCRRPGCHRCASARVLGHPSGRVAMASCRRRRYPDLRDQLQFGLEHHCRRRAPA